MLRLRFTATAGLTYTVQFRGSLTGGGWSKLTDVAAQPATQTVEVTEPISCCAQPTGGGPAAEGVALTVVEFTLVPDWSMAAMT